MIPIGDDNTYRRTVPVVTYGLIALNVLVFLAELNQLDTGNFLVQWGAVPVRISHGQGLETLVTSMFLHAGWWHLLGNMLFLFVFGDNVEDAFGHVRYLLFYLVCGVLAGLAQVLLAPDASLPGVGASGAISGVLAAYLIMFGTNPVRVLLGFFPLVVPAYVMIGVWIVLQFFNGLAGVAQTAQSGGVAYGAHIGGFVGGIVLTLVLRPSSSRRPRSRLR
ncbi:MAG TPA: rhomboid family intramembrane serine protease [Candidatus Dormibacteraeota bacterium]|nr:rhomboid family intramembrane serine protease [Candidatus Dormibacteraeota bacterium]